MPLRKVSRKDLLAGCAETGPDDGLDPRYDRPDTSAKVTNRKALQLCGQVAETLAYVLAGETGDDVLRHLMVERVEIDVAEQRADDRSLRRARCRGPFSHLLGHALAEKRLDQRQNATVRHLWPTRARRRSFGIVSK